MLKLASGRRLTWKSMRRNKEQSQYTETDLIDAFVNWRDMDRTETMNYLSVKEAWDYYAKIRDELNWRPFPTRAIVAKFKIARVKTEGENNDD